MFKAFNNDFDFTTSYLMEGKNMQNYFDNKKRFIIKDYNSQKPFSSFLPGISGIYGTPMWVFYVNRGQAIASFGVRDKNSEIMEYFPANRCYQSVEYTGFRTFIKVINQKEIYEPFSNKNGSINNNQNMYIGSNECEIEDINKKYDLKTNVLYYTLPDENIAGLVRKVTVQNLGSEEQEIEMIDGMAAVIPFGLDNDGLKSISNTLKAWMAVFNLENNIPFYKLRASSDDGAKISDINEGHFYMTFANKDGESKLLKPIVDPDVIFGSMTSLSFPKEFANSSIDELLNMDQITCNKVPSGFFGIKRTLKPGEKVEIYSIIGHCSNIDTLNSEKDKFMSAEYLNKKYKSGNEYIESLTDDIETDSSSNMFDEYCRQTYLDNLIRGGYPLILKKGNKPYVYHIYSRKHGDLERDYNFFTTEPSYFSCGNGNYRDVDQNRRNDVLFNPEVKNFNIYTFMNLLQTDGYNPLVLNGYKFKLSEDAVDEISSFTNAKDKLVEFFKNDYTPGSLFKYLEDHNISINVSKGEFLKKAIDKSSQFCEAIHGEGYWSDHWTYNLDLIENYLSVYPDKEEELLIKNNDFTYYDNAVVTLPRIQRYILDSGKVRQYNFVQECKEKKKLIDSRKDFKNAVREKYGLGNIYKCNLYEKLLNLFINKFASIDSYGMGVEMDGGKPGWNDALNGLPGLFGSSMIETYEVKRLLDFIIDESKKYKNENINVSEETVQFISDVYNNLKKYEEDTDENKEYKYWDETSTVKESYRENTEMGLSGQRRNISISDMIPVLEKFNDKLKDGINRAVKMTDGIYPSYFHYEVEKYDMVDDNEVMPTKFAIKTMPLFLEGIVRGMKIEKNTEKLRKIYRKVKSSPLYDRKLKMYKVCESLEGESFEIGRIRAFTRGWLENETIWLHMEYKYMLEVIKCGLYDEFYEDFKNVFIPFIDPDMYGRSTLENCSFIASSANPDPKIHGEGFVARLSGAAAEFLSIWSVMMYGGKPFSYKDGKLILKFSPVIPGWLFKSDNTLSFNFLGNIKVIYHIFKAQETYKGCSIEKIKLLYGNGREEVIEGGVIKGDKAEDVRNRLIKNIDIYF